MSTKCSILWTKDFTDFHVYWEHKEGCYMLDFDGHRMRVSTEWVMRLHHAFSQQKVGVSSINPTPGHRAVSFLHVDEKQLYDEIYKDE